MDKKENKKIAIRIEKCIETNYQCHLAEIVNCDIEKVSFQYSVHIAKVSEDHIVITIRVEYIYHDEVILSLSSEHYFYIENMKDLFVFNGKVLNDHLNLYPNFAGIAYGATRGMVAVHTAGTKLEARPVPLIKTSDILSKSVVKK